MNATDLAVWKEQHDCCTYHHKSSKSMEQDSAVILWNRSVAKYNFRYVEMLSDGDSSAFKAVLESKPYADKAVTKLDCINHAHKRMGTALRKLAKESHLGGRGVGRLTEKKCDSLQNFYRGAIIDNIPNVSKMRNAVGQDYTTPCLQILNTIIDNVHLEKIVGAGTNKLFRWDKTLTTTLIRHQRFCL
ncbi:hypothetical protein Bpfe_020782 [Biomphalaria pfeifferi]|uniref:Mutator-like transposase domain-containing protein n=1 Tax=Biomphalaria pfeifferi TaxID=112525 RepID=A0AAD8F494_BIOPF|nr:hypothetical protein Bpfe_020782 [Biomphalaria pfeifferi]